MTGFFDLLQDRIINLFGQAGTSNKDGDTIVCALLLSIIERLNGHQPGIVFLLLSLPH
jgi:aspartate 1-decarboxylase